MSDSAVPTLASLSLQEGEASLSNNSSSVQSTSHKEPPRQPDSAASATHAGEPSSLPSIALLNGSDASSNKTDTTQIVRDVNTIAKIKSRDFAAAALAPSSNGISALQSPATSSSANISTSSQPGSAAATTSTAQSGAPAHSATVTSMPEGTSAASTSSPTTTSPTSTSFSSPPSVSTSASPSPRSVTPSSRPPLPPSASSSAIRKPGIGGQGAGLATRIPPSLQAKMAALASRSSNPTSLQFAQNTHIGAQERIPTSSFLRQPSNPSVNSSRSAGPSQSGSPQLLPQGGGGPGRPSPLPGGAPGRVSAMGPGALAGRQQSTPALKLPGGIGGGPAGGIAKRRGPAAGLNLATMGVNGSSSSGGAGDESSSSDGGESPASAGGGINGRAGRPPMRLPSGSATGTGTPFSNFSKIVDPSGSLNFQNKAVLHAKGVDFSTGASFNINMDELELQDELGSGNYGTVQKVYHKVTKVTMAMKEIRLELDDSKLKGIITELDVLHRAVSPEIVEFYGAFFIESCVYYCMEYMDAGSLDKLAVIPVPEPVLQRVTGSMVRGLKFLKDRLQIMHRDVKPTNVLINRAGAVKLCDFGVSGQLERSLAKTNIGCQSYMAPERIKGESQNFLGTYTVSSDVWSLGLSIVEFTLGRYPYPPETYSNVFAQLTAIVHGDPPALPDGFSQIADDFVAQCLQKDAKKRPSYAKLLEHPFLKDEPNMDIDMVGWVKAALEKRASMRNPGSSSAPDGQAPAASRGA